MFELIQLKRYVAKYDDTSSPDRRGVFFFFPLQDRGEEEEEEEEKMAEFENISIVCMYVFICCT